MYINTREINDKDYYIEYYYSKTQHNPKLLVNVMCAIDRIIPDNSYMSWKDFLRRFENEIQTCNIIQI